METVGGVYTSMLLDMELNEKCVVVPVSVAVTLNSCRPDCGANGPNTTVPSEERYFVCITVLCDPVTFTNETVNCPDPPDTEAV